MNNNIEEHQQFKELFRKIGASLMSLFNYIHVHRENQDYSILYPLKSIRSMGYIYIQKTQEAVSSRFMIEQVFFTQSFT